MTLPVSGAISFNNINVELGVSGATQASLGQASYRSLAGVASGAISMSNFYGKSNQFAFNIAGGSNVNLRTAAIAAGWNQSSAVVATVTSNVTSSSTGSPALTISGSFPGGLAMTVNAGVYIVGRGGAGGNGIVGNGSAGGAGGTALSVSTAVTITNNGVIGGGGGGGASGGGYICGGGGTSDSGGGGGGGGGFGTGGTQSYRSAPGQAGTLTNGGNSGGCWPYGNSGVAGGAAGVAGTAAGNNNGKGGGGGGIGAAGGRSGAIGANGTVGALGGAAGSCTSGNSNITWAATGTRYGALN